MPDPAARARRGATPPAAGRGWTSKACLSRARSSRATFHCESGLVFDDQPDGDPVGIEALHAPHLRLLQNLVLPRLVGPRVDAHLLDHLDGSAGLGPVGHLHVEEGPETTAATHWPRGKSRRWGCATRFPRRLGGGSCGGSHPRRCRWQVRHRQGSAAGLPCATAARIATKTDLLESGSAESRRGAEAPVRFRTDEVLAGPRWRKPRPGRTPARPRGRRHPTVARLARPCQSHPPPDEPRGPPSCET